MTREKLKLRLLELGLYGHDSDAGEAILELIMSAELSLAAAVGARRRVRESWGLEGDELD